MIFPDWIKKGDTIGVTAPSAGLRKKQDFLRFDQAKKTLVERGFQVVLTDDVFECDDKGRSTDGKRRGEEFNSLLEDNSVTAIISAKGGDFLVEMLPFVNLELLKKDPKWIQGYSDNTSLLYYITTKFDIATIYGCNFGDFGMDLWHRAIEDAYGVLTGSKKSLNSHDYYESDFHDRITGFEGFFEDEAVMWKAGRGEASLEISGRLIGGCLDVLGFLCGTKYDGTLDFCERYKEDGILWYLESYHTTSEELMMKLWQFKELGWFDHASGIVFGRPCMFETYTDTSYMEAAMTILSDLNIPVLFDLDIGHKSPQFSVINGAKATISYEKGKGSLVYNIP